MNEIIYSPIVSDYEGFRSLTSYDNTFVTDHPIDDPKEGTYVIKDDNKYKIYHFVKYGDKLVCHKLHSLYRNKNLNSYLSTESSLYALISIEDSLNDELKSIIKYYKFNNKI